eukprot:m.19290 g.19290  ORF g.19290 m.19290 type:complete len:86 (+) comp12401_c0_seq1:2101-2358(+)
MSSGKVTIVGATVLPLTLTLKQMDEATNIVGMCQLYRSMANEITHTNQPKNPTSRNVSRLGSRVMSGVNFEKNGHDEVQFASTLL